jgi:hypothetical protein
VVVNEARSTRHSMPADLLAMIAEHGHVGED